MIYVECRRAVVCIRNESDIGANPNFENVFDIQQEVRWKLHFCMQTNARLYFTYTNYQKNRTCYRNFTGNFFIWSNRIQVTVETVKLKFVQQITFCLVYQFKKEEIGSLTIYEEILTRYVQSRKSLKVPRPWGSAATEDGNKSDRTFW